jgi:hypothetical protein
VRAQTLNLFLLSVPYFCFSFICCPVPVRSNLPICLAYRTNGNLCTLRSTSMWALKQSSNTQGHVALQAAASGSPDADGVLFLSGSGGTQPQYLDLQDNADTNSAPLGASLPCDRRHKMPGIACHGGLSF